MRARRPDPAMLGNSGYERILNDAYYTERWVTETLLSQVRFRGAVWEPAAGRGDISVGLRGAGTYVIRQVAACRGDRELRGGESFRTAFRQI